MAEREPKQRTPKGSEIPEPRPADAEAIVDETTKRAHDRRRHDGPQEVEDAARQEVEYPADETDEG